MQDINWNDLRFVLAVARAGTLASAARLLSVNETTVSRRVARIETILGSQLFHRADGAHLPTEAGAAVLAHAERVESEIASLRETASGANLAVAGNVRLTSIPLLLNRLLVPEISVLLGVHPQLRLELIAEPRNLSLTKRDADIALRLARPDKEQRVLARRLALLQYAVFGPRSKAAASLPWITYIDDMLELPHVAWLDEAARAEKEKPSIAVNDLEVALHAMQAGLGKSLLPCVVGDHCDGLERLSGEQPVLARELWFLVHPDLAHLARVKAVAAWIEDAIRRRVKPN